jgi:hypothetical protein
MSREGPWRSKRNNLRRYPERYLAAARLLRVASALSAHRQVIVNAVPKGLAQLIGRRALEVHHVANSRNRAREHAVIGIERDQARPIAFVVHGFTPQLLSSRRAASTAPLRM